MARPRKHGNPTVGASASTIEKLKREGSPHIDFLADLEHRDATEVHYKDKNREKEYVKRWCLEANMGLRQSQGYKVVDPAIIGKNNSPGGKTHWEAEGGQAKLANRGLVLMEIPREIHDLRQTVKREQWDERTLANSKKLRNDIDAGGVHEGQRYAKALDSDDEFIGRLSK